ncbi:MAG: phosphoglucosamine mutase [Candidatus Sumerlaeia bacterium]|nr:phosphoglucosamine mutase [Candidatus Sumerlaeia bacterium]
MATTAEPGARSPLMVSVAGVRGIVGDALTPEVVAAFVSAYARTLPGRMVLVGGDSRASRAWIEPLVVSTLVRLGKEVVRIGLAPTPTFGILVREFKAAGGVAITASHNPAPYNGLKFFTAKGVFLGPEEFAAMKEALGGPEPSPAARPAEEVSLPPEESLLLHRAAVQAALPIRRGRLKVLIDCCNGAGSYLAPAVARDYGAAPMALFDDPTREFPHEAEPLPENLSALRKSVCAEGAALGFAIDPDADRLALVDECGRAIGEERTLLLAADAYLALAKRKGPIVANLSSTRALDDLAAKHGVRLHRSKVGEAHVVGMIREKRALIGGEGNGGVIVPAVHPGRDAATGIALILLGLAQKKGRTLAKWNAEFPDYTLVKDKVSIEGLDAKAILARLPALFPGGEADDTDGLKIVFPDRWVQVRASGTEPILRVFAEAPTEDGARALVAAARGAVR